MRHPHHLLLLSGRLLLFLFFLLPMPAHAGSTCRAEVATTTITLTGFTRPRTTLDLTPEVSGRCMEVRADIGQPVPEDTIFARIDSTFIDLELETNRLAVTRTEKSLAFDEKQVKRYRKLVTTKASARTRLEELELQYEQTGLKLRELQTRQKRLRETLARHTLHAPAGWLVIERTLEPGEWVRAGQSVARVGDYRHLVIPVLLRPEELEYLRKTGDFSLSLVDTGVQGTGRIWRIAPNFDPATRKTKVDLILSDRTLEQIKEKRGGLRVEIPIRLKDPMHAFLLPAAAVEERYEENWLTRENGETFRVIVLGPELPATENGDRRLRVVSEKINEGDRFRCRESRADEQQQQKTGARQPHP